MATIEPLSIIKSLAKKLARARRIRHNTALDITAEQFGYPHWNALTAGYKGDWRPSWRQIRLLREFVDTADPSTAREPNTVARHAISCVPGITLIASTTQLADTTDPFSEEEILGELDGHPFRLKVSFNDVIMEGRGWRIRVPEAQSANPCIHVTDRRFKSPPILEQGFRERASKAAQIRAEHVRARIASVWPRQSTVPDAGGNVQHPLRDDFGDRWFCLHCEQIFSGEQMADNLWHCPACSATPIDIFAADRPFAASVKRGRSGSLQPALRDLGQQNNRRR